MVNGSQEEKYKISYRLIDFENKGFFGIEEFSFMISSMVSVWCGLTGTQICIKDIKIFLITYDLINYLFLYIVYENFQK